MARKHAFKQADIARALKGALSAGLKVERVEILDGKIVLVAAGAPVEPVNELDAWRAKRDARQS